MLWLLTICFISASSASGAESPAIVAACTGCHGADGNSVMATWPNLAGQPAEYVAKQLRDFKAGVRTDPMMAAIVLGLDEAQISEAAAWYSAQQPSPPTESGSDAPPSSVGETLFQDGDRSRGLAPCRACHGPDGLGGQDARGNAFPALAGQWAEYTEKQLSSFASGERSNDRGGMMTLVAGRLGSDEIVALAAYVASLPASTADTGGPP